MYKIRQSVRVPYSIATGYHSNQTVRMAPAGKPPKLRFQPTKDHIESWYQSEREKASKDG